MFCKKCGAQVEDNAAFCSECGTPVEQGAESQEKNQNVQETVQFDETKMEESTVVEEPQEKKPFNKNVKGIIGIVAVVIVAILAIKFLASIFTGSSDYVMTVYDGESGESTVYVNDKKIDTVEGHATVYTNMDSSVFYVEDGKGTLHYVKGRKLVEVMDDCSEVIVSNHSDVILVIDNDSELYRCEKDDKEEIYSDDVVSSAAISGNGEYYCYSILSDDGDSVSYIGKKPGKEEKIKDFIAGAMSEDGKYTYGVTYNEDYESNLVVSDRKGKTETIAKGVDDIIGFNEDGTEVMFTQDEKTYISNKGKDKVKVTGDSVYRVYYEDTNTKLNGTFYPVKSFKDTAVYTSGELCLINNKYEAEEVVDDISDIVCVTDDFSRVIFVSDDELCYAKLKKDAKEETLAEDVSYSVGASNDGKEIYFLNEDDELCYIKGTGKAKKVEDVEVSGYNGYVCGGNLYIQNSDEDGWYCVSGKKAEELDVDSIIVNRKADKVFAYKEDKLYSVNGDKLKELKGDFDEISGVSIY